MTLIRADGVVEDDYASVAEDGPIVDGRILLSWARWLQEFDARGIDARLVGLRLPNTLDVEQVRAQLTQHPLIALEFPSFPDGRAYSQARLLRDRIGFAGELRATGMAVVLDQLHALRRCGFDSFELRADQDALKCVAAMGSNASPYQPAADGALPILRRRRG